MATLLSFLFYVTNSRRILTVYLWILSAIYATLVVARNIYLIVCTLAVLAAVCFCIALTVWLGSLYLYMYPVWKQWKASGNDRCICLEDAGLENDAVILPCGHCLHEHCAHEWRTHFRRRQDRKCPFCRQHFSYALAPDRARRACFAVFDGIANVERFTSNVMCVPKRP